MAGKKQFELHGEKELMKKLNKMDMKDAKKIIFKPAVHATLKEKLLPKVLSNAPVKSGQLRDMTAVKSMKRSRKHFGYMISNSPGKSTKGGTADFSGKAYYGAFLEYGTKPRQTRFPVWVPFLNSISSQRGQIAARNWISSAYKSKKGRLGKLMELKIKKALEKQASK